jgi:hypothetical protein
MKRILCAVLFFTAAASFGWGSRATHRETQQESDSAAVHNQRAIAHHTRRSLDDASREYARTLELDPPRELTAAQWALIRRFAPRLYTTPAEFFPLKDFTVILHPAERLIAYHFFWGDDIDFPEDNDPCDHELIWVKYAGDNETLEGVWAYFHGRILAGGETALRDARRHAMRPRVNVQWGKHGSLLAGWEQMKIIAEGGDAERKYYPLEQSITLKQYNEGTYRKLSTEGRRLPDHPLGARLGWPPKFTGRWEDFTNFSRLIDPLTMLGKTKMARVSRWNNATIDQHFLAYNFRPKTEWPPADLNAERSEMKLTVRTIDEFQLPAKSVFDKSMPRYPNVWFYVDAALASSYDAAVRLVTDNLRSAMSLREYYGPFDNPEGCDFEVRLEHLQPWEDRRQRALQHSHAFHMRYYFSALARQNLAEVVLKTAAGDRKYYRFGASAHYEVEHTNPNHADVELCPICGRTGEYSQLQGNLVELAHDPLGLELVLKGTIRGEIVQFEDAAGREVGSVAGLKSNYSVQQYLFPAQTGDRNTLRIGVVVIGPTGRW